mmetsp:Transcript_14934/g.20774  ORF Transcript_14934/g.20774 Transcript_14934/m.20774 type:complete len:181 (+) Transcript_14934:301-843(+)
MQQIETIIRASATELACDTTREHQVISASKDGNRLRGDPAETTTPTNMKAQDNADVRLSLPLHINRVAFRLQPLTILSFMQNLNRTKDEDRSMSIKSNKVLSSFIHDSQNAIVGWSAARLLHVKQPFEVKAESTPILIDRLEQNNADFANRSRKRKATLASPPSESISGNKRNKHRELVS